MEQWLEWLLPIALLLCAYQCRDINQLDEKLQIYEYQSRNMSESIDSLQERCDSLESVIEELKEEIESDEEDEIDGWHSVQ